MLFNCIPTIHQRAVLPLPRSAKSCIAALSLLAVPLRLKQRATYHAICDYVLLRVVCVGGWVSVCVYLACVCVCVQHCTCTLPQVGMLACLHIYSPFCRSETPPPPAAAHVLYVVRSSIQSASGHVGVDALRHAWRDCAKGSHYHQLIARVRGLLA